MRTRILFISMIFCSSMLHSQSRPFPQNINYTKGFKPTNLSSTDVQAVYDNWKAKYLKSDCGSGYYRVEFNDPTGSTVSEGMGYGMVITAYFGERTYFDGLFAFVKKNFNTNSYMGWKVTCDGFITSVGGKDAATDGDLDIAFALCLASNQWGETYKAEAVKYINNLKKLFKKGCDGRWIQKPGDWLDVCWGNTSYWDPGYYRVFQEFTGDTDWQQIAADTYTILSLTRNKTTGLIANECGSDGTIHNNNPYVDYNGCRIPWRIVVDYLWYGNDSAKNICDKMTDWADNKGISTLVDGYNIDGTPTSGHNWTQSNPFTGGWACGAMTKSADRANRFTANFKNCTFDDYFGQSLRTLYMLALTGNYWKPDVTVGVKVISSAKPTIQVTPNPSSLMYINIAISDAGAEQLKIFNTSGKMVFARNINNQNQLTVDVNNFRKGLYFIQVQTKNQQITEKVVLQ